MNKKALIYLGYLLCLGLFAAAILILHKELRHFHFSDITEAIHAVPMGRISLAVVLTFVDYLLLTCYDLLGLFYLGRKIPYPRVALASFVGYVFSHNMTFLGGGTARYRLYSVLSVPTNEITKLILFCSSTFWLGNLTLAGIVFALNPPSSPEGITIPLFSLKTAGFIFLCVPAGYLLFAAIRKASFIVFAWEFKLPPFSIALTQIVMGVIDLALVGMILYLLLPVEANLTYTAFLGTYLFALTAGLISHVPGGVGVFDTVIVLMLKPLIPLPAILSALMLYRLLYYFIPFVFATSLIGIHETLLHQDTIKRISFYAGKLISVMAIPLLTVFTAIAGIILLFSGSLPSLHGRIHFLRTVVPLPAIEISHFLGSLAGAALLMLSRSIQRRINAAYPIVIVLLSGGIVFSLLKGLDYEEAIAMTFILLVFLPCRGLFYRKAALFTKRFTPGWVALIIAVLLCSAWLGFFSYRHVEYNKELWWRFALHSDAPRFLRAMAGATILVILYAIAELLKPASRHHAPSGQTIISTVNAIVSASPKTYAHLALLGDKQFLLGQSQTSFLMYAVQGRSWIVMGDPVGPESDWDELLWDFREKCDMYGGWPVFYQVDKAYLDYYLDLGLSFLKLGEEARVPLHDFSLDGPQRRDLRYSHRKVRKENMTFSIVLPSETPAIIDQLKTISDAWLDEKKGKEKKFSIGFFSPDYIRRFPIAAVYLNSTIIAFANIWAGANKAELSVDLMRHLPSAPNGIMDFLFAELMLWGKSQGYQYFNLGMAPMSGMEGHPLASLWQKTGHFLFRYGDNFYNFQGLRKYKEKFLPEWNPKYLACPHGLVLPQVLANLTMLISGGTGKS